MFNEFCAFLGELYGGSSAVTSNSLGHTIITITNKRDVFYVNLQDKVRFGSYTLYHQSRNGTFHKQNTFSSLFYALVTAYSHDDGKSRHYRWDKQDYERLRADWKKTCGRQVYSGY